MEWGRHKRRGLMASMPQLGVPIGLLLSTGVVKLLATVSGEGFDSWGWRVPFLLSVVLMGIGLYVRLRVLESPEFAAVRKAGAVVDLPVWEAVRRYPRQILAAAFVRMSEQAPFYLFITFVLTYGTKQVGLDRDNLLSYTMIAAAIGLVCVPLFGRLSDRIGRRTVYGAGVIATAVFAFPHFGLLDTGTAGLVLLAVVVSLIVHDVQYGPQAALIAEGFDSRVRYSGAGIGYHLASVVAGGPAPLIATAILQHTGSSTWISLYIIGCALVSMTALVAMPRPAAAGPVDRERTAVTAGAGRRMADPADRG